MKLGRSRIKEMAEPEHYERVKELCARIYADTCFQSSHATDHPAYLKIVATGEAVVPALLCRIAHYAEHSNDEGADNMMAVWEPICALGEITRADVVPKEDDGRLLKSIEHWLNWGHEQGIDWGSTDG